MTAAAAGARGPAPDRCENCGFAQKYSRQRAGERPAFCTGHEKWLCFGCRDQLECGKLKHRIDTVPPRVDVTGIPSNDGIYATIDDDVYHSDLASLSSSGARDLLASTPEEFDFNRRTPRDPNRNYDFGHAAHKMVLGKGSRLAMLDPKIHGLKADGKPAAVPTSTSMWKNAAKAARDKGQIPIAKADMQKAQTMAGKVFQHRTAARLLSEGRAEHSIYWHDDATGVRLRCRPDFITDGLGRTICVDYKTSTSAKPSQFQRAVMDYGYHMQQAFYEVGLAELGYDDIGFVFIVQSKTAPYAVSVCSIDPEIVELGHRQNRAAIELFARCTESGRWPGYEGIQPVGMAGWAIKQIEESLEAFYQPIA
ncbi:recE [Mycobacteroides abscessus subsp. massiliense]|nr:recE [Mycobacteroides abscessus subsp. massiliense]SKH84210.1 recE [Mycobacteroides abscessus subsp. massiliense]SKK33601.1 recE [Mycobacteroides abscessus subsp. massiliense]SKK45759.1 recE [Mycobacteroides abscessus subsp. massiliense]SKL87378.1 recE [Mycobacteroides abscessus subsp. massiliense]